MDIVQTVINSALIAVVGVFIAFITRHQIQDVKENLGREIRDVKEDLGREIRDLKTDLTDDISQLRADNVRLEDRMELRFGRVETELAGLRSDVTQMAFALGTQPKPQTG